MIFSCENPDPDNRRFMDRTGVECRARIAKVTVPLFTEQFGKTFVCGSGVLLQIAEKGFIVSAGHTFDARKIANLPLWVTNGVVDSKLLPLGEVTIRSSATNDPVDRTDEPYDIAVCELPAETTAQIVGEKQFLRLIDVDPWDRQDPRSWYKVFGFPTALSPADEAAKRIPSHAVALATFLYRDERGPLDRFEPDVGIAVDFDTTNMRADDGSPAVPPHPGGMSGCGIWRIVEADTETNAWKLDDVKLVAIEHTLKTGKKVLVGTRIRYALQMIYRNHPDLRPAMEMRFGQRARNL